VTVPLSSSSLSTASPDLAAVVGFDDLAVPGSRSAEEISADAAGVPAVSAGPAEVPVPVPTAVPSEEPGACGAAVWEVGPASVFTLDVWLTGVEPAVAGVVVTVVPEAGTTVVLVGAGTVVVTTDCSVASDTIELPLPVGTVVVGAGATVVLTAGAAVVGGLDGATVVAVAAVPWVPVWVPAGGEAGAVSAEADPVCSTRKRPARSAKDATHLRGLTTSFLGLVLIGLDEPPRLHCGRGGRKTAAGTRAVNHGPEQGGKDPIGPLTCTYVAVGGCWTDQRVALERPSLPGAGRLHRFSTGVRAREFLRSPEPPPRAPVGDGAGWPPFRVPNWP
jgi:hypothetical protein